MKTRGGPYDQKLNFSSGPVEQTSTLIELVDTIAAVKCSSFQSLKPDSQSGWGQDEGATPGPRLDKSTIEVNPVIFKGYTMTLSQQSPINLENAIYAELGSQAAEIRWKKTGTVAGHLVKSDHGVKLLFTPGNGQTVRLGGKAYELIEFHFHHPSEHWVEGVQRFMELHAVHRAVADGTAFCVLGIFIDITGSEAAEHQGVRSFLDEAHRVLSAPEEEPEQSFPRIRMHDFLPESPEHYFRYEGSLTTGEHDEIVSWVVMKNSLRVALHSEMELLKHFKAPARNAQPLNRRFLLRTFE